MIGVPAESADFELYDYQEDPGETRDIAQNQPGIVSELQAILPRHPEAKMALIRKGR